MTASTARQLRPYRLPVLRKHLPASDMASSLALDRGGQAHRDGTPPTCDLGQMSRRDPESLSQACESAALGKAVIAEVHAATLTHANSCGNSGRYVATATIECMKEVRRQRLEKLLKERFGGSQKELAVAIGRSPAQISQWLSRFRNISEDSARAVEVALQLPLGWMDVDNADNPLRTDSRPRHGESVSLLNNPDYPAIRLVRFKLSAGASGFAIEYLDSESTPIVFKREWFEAHGYSPSKLFAIRVCNGSMEPGLYDGDTVIVNTSDINPKDGAVFAANFEGELVVKRMERDAGQWWLSSDNPNKHLYPRKQCHEGVFLIGRIVHKMSDRI